MDLNNRPITGPQLRRLQTLYGQLAAHAQEAGDRVSRLLWASNQVRREIISFSLLTAAEGKQLIDGLQGQLGVNTPTRPRRRLDRRAAHQAGTAGRRGAQDKEIILASVADFARIRHALALIGWSREQLDAWLRSPSSPLRSKASAAIRTLADANRVWWALKRMAKSQGKWKDRA